MAKPPERPQADTQVASREDGRPSDLVTTSKVSAVSSDPPSAWVLGNPRLTAEAASRIALRHALNAAAGLPHDDLTSPIVYKVCDSSVSRAHCYGDSAGTGVWHVFLPWFDGYDGRMLRSSRVIAISQHDGRVLFDGSANDEG